MNALTLLSKSGRDTGANTPLAGGVKLPVRALAGVAATFMLTACATPRPPVSVPPLADPCPAEGLAVLQAEPVHPIADPVELGRVFGAISTVIGSDRAQALVRFWETEMPTHARQGWSRVKRTKEWCDGRLTTP